MKIFFLPQTHIYTSKIPKNLPKSFFSYVNLDPNVQKLYIVYQHKVKKIYSLNNFCVIKQKPKTQKKSKIKNIKENCSNLDDAEAITMDKEDNEKKNKFSTNKWLQGLSCSFNFCYTHLL